MLANETFNLRFLKRTGWPLFRGPRSVREVASVLYRRALDDEDLIRGRSIEGVATSTLYAACRMEGFRDRWMKSRLYHALNAWRLVARIGISPRNSVLRWSLLTRGSTCLGSVLSLIYPKKYRQRQMKSLIRQLKKGCCQESHQLDMPRLRSTRAHSFVMRKKTQREVSNVVQVTEVTLRNRYQEQIGAMGLGN